MKDKTHVFAGDYEEINMAEIARRQAERMSVNEHVWAMAMVYHTADPEQALDSMVLNSETLLGFSDISCVRCHVAYRKEIRHETCRVSIWQTEK